MPTRSFLTTVLVTLLIATISSGVSTTAVGQCPSGGFSSQADSTPVAIVAESVPLGSPGEPREEMDLSDYFHRIGPDATLWFQHVQALASPAYEGRAPGTRGIELAAEYIEFHFRAYGLKPPFLADGSPGEESTNASYRQALTVDGSLLEGYETRGALSVDGKTLVAGEDFVITGNSRKGNASGPVTFVGYGIDLGEDGYSSFDAQADLNGRVALLLRLEPLDETGGFLWSSEAGKHSSLMTKIKAVADRGAAAILIVNPPGAKAEVEQLDPLPGLGGGCSAPPSIPTAMIAQNTAERIIEQATNGTTDLMVWRRWADRGEVRTVDFSDDVIVGLQTDVEAEQVNTENVAALLPGRGTLRDEWIVIGGHYDAVGAVNGSASHSDVLLGADDNASGTAGVLILARRLADAYARMDESVDLRSIMFVAFTAEERGLVGSRYFVEESPVPIQNIHAMVNLDMIGRLHDDMVWIGGYETAAEFASLLASEMERGDLQIITDQGSGGSDYLSFTEARIPAIHVMTGGTDELHTPDDVASTVNPAGANKVIDLVENITMRLAQNGDPLTYVDGALSTGEGCPRKDEEAPTGEATSPGGCGGASPESEASVLPNKDHVTRTQANG